MTRSRALGLTTVAALVATTVAVAPSANAWETTYDSSKDVCTINFDARDRGRVNDAYKTLFAEMAKQTDNAKLKQSFADASKRPFFPDDKPIVMTPDEALETGGILYGVDVAKIVIPQGIEATVKGIGLEKIVKNIDMEQLLSDVNFEAVMASVDMKAAVGEVNTKAALETLPIDKVLENVDWANVQVELNEEQLKTDLQKDLKTPKFQDLLKLAGNDPLDALAQILKSMGIAPQQILTKMLANTDANLDDVFAQAVAKADIDEQKVLDDALGASGVDLKQVVKNVTEQEAFKKALDEELAKIDFGAAIKDAVEKSGIELTPQAILGFEVSDVTLAAGDAFDAVGPQVLAPIATMNGAFTACSDHSETVKQRAAKRGKASGSSLGSSNGSSTDPNKASGSVAAGSSLDMEGLKIVSILGAVAALLGMGVLGFALRPMVDQFLG